MPIENFSEAFAHENSVIILFTCLLECGALSLRGDVSIFQKFGSENSRQGSFT
jgi:hypothetical protein